MRMSFSFVVIGALALLTLPTEAHGIVCCSSKIFDPFEMEDAGQELKGKTLRISYKTSKMSLSIIGSKAHEACLMQALLKVGRPEVDGDPNITSVVASLFVEIYLEDKYGNDTGSKRVEIAKVSIDAATLKKVNVQNKLAPQVMCNNNGFISGIAPLLSSRTKNASYMK